MITLHFYLELFKIIQCNRVITYTTWPLFINILNSIGILNRYLNLRRNFPLHFAHESGHKRNKSFWMTSDHWSLTIEQYSMPGVLCNSLYRLNGWILNQSEYKKERALLKQLSITMKTDCSFPSYQEMINFKIGHLCLLPTVVV